MSAPGIVQSWWWNTQGAPGNYFDWQTATNFPTGYFRLWNTPVGTTTVPPAFTPTATETK